MSAVLELTDAGRTIKSNPSSCSAGYGASLDDTELDIYLLREHLQDSYFKFQFELADVLEDVCSTKSEYAGLMFLVLTERNEAYVEEQFRRRGVPELTSVMKPENVVPQDGGERSLPNDGVSASLPGRKTGRRRRKVKRQPQSADPSDEESDHRPDTEAEFRVENNPFAFSPGQMNKLLNPKSLTAYRALGGFDGIQRGLRSDRNAELVA